MTRWVQTERELNSLASTLCRKTTIAVDTEAASMYHYWDRVCLVQLYDGGDDVYLVDTVALRDLSPLAPIFADPGIRKVLHGADYDVSTLRRDFNFQINGMFDTMLAARFLGWDSVGLAAAVQRVFDITLEKGPQTADWSMRPLTPEMEKYAALDVLYLIHLANHLQDKLTEMGRLDWVLEESTELANLPACSGRPGPADWHKLNGINHFSDRERAVLDVLFKAREDLAMKLDKPRFKVVSDSVLIQFAINQPRTERDISGIQGVPRPIRRNFNFWLKAVAEGLARDPIPWTDDRHSTRERPSATVAMRLGELRTRRLEWSARLGLEPGVLLPQRLITPLAVEGPMDLVAMSRIEGIRRWRIEAIGEDILEVMHSSVAHKNRSF